MNPSILNKKVQDFINENIVKDISEIALKGSPFAEVSNMELVSQIESKEKTRKKLPTWFRSKNIYYPLKLHIEQTSSEITALYKSEIVTGETLADLTGGLGVDSFYFSKVFKKVYYYEQNKELYNIASHNFKQLKADIETFAEDGISAIENLFFEVIYIDPSRRHDIKGKVFLFSDCEPDIVSNLNYLLKRCKTLIIKSSPMLDITAGLKELKEVSAIHIVSVENEVKELLWVLTSEDRAYLKVVCINITKSGTESFSFNPEIEAKAIYSQPLAYLYEPNSSIMKSGAFETISERYSVGKLHKSSHLYTSDSMLTFPGRRFKIEKVVPYSKKELKRSLKMEKANVSTRNFPETVDVIRKKWNLKDGGDNYLFFTTDMEDKKVILVCTKI